MSGLSAGCWRSWQGRKTSTLLTGKVPRKVPTRVSRAPTPLRIATSELKHSPGAARHVCMSTSSAMPRPGSSTNRDIALVSPRLTAKAGSITQYWARCNSYVR